MDFLYESTSVIITAALLLAFSGVPGLIFTSRVAGQRIAAIISIVAAILGELAVIRQFSGANAATYELQWTLPFTFPKLSLDPLSILFLIPLFLITACASLYSLAYWPAREKKSASKLTFFMGIFAASMVFVVTARNSILFLVAWEIMALSAYFLLSTDQQSREVQRVGTIYLLAAHTGTAALMVMFSLLNVATGSFNFPDFHSLSLTLPVTSTIIISALAGFGGKAGIMPVHFWLPGAHASAPSHVSAMMSGLMLKMGIYGILRTFSFFYTIPSWVGWFLFFSGLISALYGIALATAQKDLKRMLACSSIENIGIICIGIGLALIGMELHANFLVVCGLAGAFIHIINHALFKSLLFMGSGALIHATGTREIDLMGGLAKKMPVTSLLFLTGSLAICGLPPLNGFVGELFLYVAAITEGVFSPSPLVAMAAPVLALVGGIAVITFVKLYGIIFLGTPRSMGAANGHESNGLMIWSMLVLGVCCLIGGLVPIVLLKLVTPALCFYSMLTKSSVEEITSRVPLNQLSLLNFFLLTVCSVVAVLYFRKLKKSSVESCATWGCGYLAPTSRMQYTGTSFSELVVSMLGSVIGSLRNRPDFKNSLFPGNYFSFRYFVTETVLERFLTPLFFWAGFGFSYLRRLQHGHLHIYMVYILATLLVLMAWNH